MGLTSLRRLLLVSLLGVGCARFGFELLELESTTADGGVSGSAEVSGAGAGGGVAGLASTLGGNGGTSEALGGNSGALGGSGMGQGGGGGEPVNTSDGGAPVAPPAPFDAGTPCAGTANCQCRTFSGSQYWFCSNELTGAAAATQCQSAGMSLVRIDNAAENDWITATGTALETFGGRNGYAWSGANDQAVEGQWAWPDGDVFWSGTASGAPVGGLYTNWNGQSPRLGAVANCGGLLGDSGLWQERDCEGSAASICEGGA